MKIWAKVMDGDKIYADTVYEDRSPASFDNFVKWVDDICKTLDCSTPILLLLHYRRFLDFKNVKFKPDDFVESLGHDRLVLEQF